jgi:hypothetical protein
MTQLAQVLQNPTSSDQEIVLLKDLLILNAEQKAILPQTIQRLFSQAYITAALSLHVKNSQNLGNASDTKSDDATYTESIGNLLTNLFADIRLKLQETKAEAKVTETLEPILNKVLEAGAKRGSILCEMELQTRNLIRLESEEKLEAKEIATIVNRSLLSIQKYQKHSTFCFFLYAATCLYAGNHYRLQLIKNPNAQAAQEFSQCKNRYYYDGMFCLEMVRLLDVEDPKAVDSIFESKSFPAAVNSSVFKNNPFFIGVDEVQTEVKDENNDRAAIEKMQILGIWKKTMKKIQDDYGIDKEIVTQATEKADQQYQVEKAQSQQLS